MPSNPLSRLRGLCAALPKSTLDRQFESLTRRGRLLVFGLSTTVALTVPRLVPDDGALAVGVALGFGTFAGLTDLLADGDAR